MIYWEIYTIKSENDDKGIGRQDGVPSVQDYGNHGEGQQNDYKGIGRQDSVPSVRNYNDGQIKNRKFN